MNLMSCFNFKFFKENIKKSKGILAFILGIIPLANILLLVSFIVNKSYLIDFGDLGLLSYIGLFVVPVILSYTLFGFILKKKSVDFYLSKPISRKSIYLTNIIGGIGILFIFTLINVVIFAVFSIFSSLYIPFGLILDYFVYWFVSYLFMFLISSLAMILAGNFITSVVILLLIICMFPFLRTVSNTLTTYNTDYYIYCNVDDCKPQNYICDTKECKEHLANNEYYYNLVKNDNSSYNAMFSYIFNGYRTKDIIKMVVLSVITVIVGLFAFLKRKMENNECSFKNEVVHYFVKTLTFIPICAVSYACFKDDIWTVGLFAILLSFAYYIIYDLITRRKIYKFWKSFFVFLGSFGLLTGGFALWDIVTSKDVVLKQIDSIVFDYETMENIYNNIEITDKNIINSIIKDSMRNNYNYYSNENYYELKIKVVSDKKDYSISLTGANSTSKIIEKYIKDNNIKGLKENFDFTKVGYITLLDREIPITEELINILKTTNHVDRSSSWYNLYIYEDHTYKQIGISIDENKEIAQYGMSYLNNDYTNAVKDLSIVASSISSSKDDNLSDLDRVSFYYIISKNKQEFIKFLNEHKNDTMNIDEFFRIVTWIEGKNYSYFINADILKEELTKYKEILKDDKGYKEILKSYES